jgi:hypothetical protein
MPWWDNIWRLPVMRQIPHRFHSRAAAISCIARVSNGINVLAGMGISEVPSGDVP